MEVDMSLIIAFVQDIEIEIRALLRSWDINMQDSGNCRIDLFTSCSGIRIQCMVYWDGYIIMNKFSDKRMIHGVALDLARPETRDNIIKNFREWACGDNRKVLAQLKEGTMACGCCGGLGHVAGDCPEFGKGVREFEEREKKALEAFPKVNVGEAPDVQLIYQISPILRAHSRIKELPVVMDWLNKAEEDPKYKAFKKMLGRC